MVVAASIGFLMPSANAAEHTLMPSPQTVVISTDRRNTLS